MTRSPTFAPRSSEDMAAVRELQQWHWRLARLDGRAVPASSRTELILGPDKATGSGGCNSFGGDYVMDVQQIRFTGISSTALGCPEPGVLDREEAFYRALRNARTWTAGVEDLKLFDEGGTERARFERTSGPAPSSLGPSPTSSVTDATAAPERSQSPSPSPAGVGPDDLQDAIRFRRSFGLRADVAYIATVAKDPSAVLDYGVPLLPAEKADLDRRASADDLALLIAYTETHPESFAGLYIDQQAGGVIVVRFVGDPMVHQALVSGLVPGRRVVVRSAEWTQAELQALMDRVTNDGSALARLGAALRWVGPDVIGNVVEIGVSSADPAIAQRLAERYGADRVRVVSDGTGVGLLPVGRIEGLVVDRNGMPVSGASIDYQPLQPVGSLPAIGYLSGADGRFSILRTPPVRWRLRAQVTTAGISGPWGPYADVEVPPGGVGTVTLFVPTESVPGSPSATP